MSGYQFPLSTTNHIAPAGDCFVYDNSPPRTDAPTSTSVDSCQIASLTTVRILQVQNIARNELAVNYTSNATNPSQTSDQTVSANSDLGPILGGLFGGFFGLFFIVGGLWYLWCV